jgi:hypothetical protein
LRIRSVPARTSLSVEIALTTGFENTGVFRVPLSTTVSR